jgi:PAS domain S-box-containing protein
MNDVRRGWRRGIGELRMALADGPGRAAMLFLAMLDRLPHLQRLALIWSIGSAGLAAMTVLSLRLGFNFTTTAFAFLIIIVLLCLLDSFISSALFSIIGVGLLNFFFVQPLHTFIVWDVQDMMTLTAFFVTSIAVTGLVRRVRDLTGVQREQAQLRAAINTIPVIVWSTQPSGENDFHNQRLLSYTGFSPQHALASGWMEMIHPDDLDRHGRAWTTAVQTRTSFEMESRLRRFDGEYRWFLARAEPLRDDRGNVVKWYGTNVDIDDRKQAEDALRRSEAYLAEAQKLSHTGSFGWNLSTGDIVWSDETYRIFEYDLAERPSIALILRRVHPDDVALVRRVVDHAARDRQDLDFEHRLRMPDGSIKHLHVVARRSAGQEGNQHFIGAVMDITAQKRAYAELQRSEQRYRHLFNHMPIGLYQTDSRKLVDMFDKLRADGVTDLTAYFDAHPDFLRTCLDALIIEEINERAVQMLGGRDASDFLGSPIGWAWQEGSETMRRALVSRFRGETNFEEETKLARRDGRILDVLFSRSRIADPAIGLTGIVDISQRIRAQEMLNRMQADFAHAARVSVLGELTASIAHEVNQPLAAIAANGEVGLRLLARPDPDLAELHELTESVVADARRASDIIARIRTMAAREAPGRELIALDDLIREALLFLRHEVQSRAVAVSHYVAPAAVKVLADRTQLQQVIVNLAVNAMHAMAQAGSAERRIAIRTVLIEPAVLRCIVEDSGPGIAPEHLPRLFDSFFTTKQGGMGMGLPICQSIIEVHGGRITAENGGAAGGARFSFTLPVAGLSRSEESAE